MERKRVPPTLERADRPPAFTMNRLSIRIVEEYNALYSITSLKHESFRDYIGDILFRVEQFINETCSYELCGGVAELFSDLIALYERVAATV